MKREMVFRPGSVETSRVEGGGKRRESFGGDQPVYYEEKAMGLSWDSVCMTQIVGSEWRICERNGEEIFETEQLQPSYLSPFQQETTG